jgi:hypothetical protein
MTRNIDGYVKGQCIYYASYKPNEAGNSSWYGACQREEAGSESDIGGNASLAEASFSILRLNLPVFPDRSPERAMKRIDASRWFDTNLLQPQRQSQ